MADMIGAFWLELGLRSYYYNGFYFTLVDVFYASVFLSVVGIFLNHLIGDFIKSLTS